MIAQSLKEIEVNVKNVKTDISNQTEEMIVLESVHRKVTPKEKFSWEPQEMVLEKARENTDGQMERDLLDILKITTWFTVNILCQMEPDNQCEFHFQVIKDHISSLIFQIHQQMYERKKNEYKSMNFLNQ